MGRLRGLLGVGAALAVLAACTSPGTAAPARAVQSFLTALSDGDGSAACGWLAPLVVDELEQQSDEPCVDAVVDPDVADALAGTGAPTPRGAEVYGSQAVVAVTAGTYFLAMDGDDWRITGAGCVTRPDMPADCVLAGG